MVNKSDFNDPVSAYILIVDDNPQNLQVLGKLLIENKYRIEFAINGEGALEWISKIPFDLILLDINMPGMNGFEVCIKIRSNPSFRNIPVIFISAETDRESILKGFELGAQDYVVKPFDARELLSRIQTHLTLKDSLEKLESQNLILDAKVAERTLQLREANEQLNHLNLKLLDLDKAKTEFLRLVSHEIRTPLNGIIGPVELLKESEASREIGELIDILDSSVKRLEKFSLNALLITRLNTKQTDIKIDPVSLEGVLSELIEEKAEVIHKHGLSIKYINESKKGSILGETELVKICIGNILDNTLLFVPENGIVEILIYDEDNYVVCNFVDNGPGFNTEEQSKLFEILSMGNIKKDASLGTGLPICKLIMNAHSGEIQVGNNPESGAFVKLLFKHE
ncbi:MAG: hybrid sensor histidine kinase/response regulator [Bacteroidetes bacterium]|nr:hybrid sensor histidine kinase/response regulator [Bacteroidota bacterium]